MFLHPSFEITHPLWGDSPHKGPVIQNWSDHEKISHRKYLCESNDISPAVLAMGIFPSEENVTRIQLSRDMNHHHACTRRISQSDIILWIKHYGDVTMDATESQITSLTVVYSTVYSDADQRIHQSSVSLAFVRGIHRGPVGNSPHKWPVTRKMFPFDDVIMRRGTPNSKVSF